MIKQWIFYKWSKVITVKEALKLFINMLIYLNDWNVNKKPKTALSFHISTEN